MDNIDFTVERIKLLWGQWENPEFLAEIAFLYDSIVKTGTHEPIIDMGMKLIIPFEDIGSLIEKAMDEKYLTTPKRGTWGGTITKKALKILKQNEK